ncbi:MAG: CvpA family protein [Betaproteobacteria bacterium]|nr:CvpA family protein [Betaproteobacteria bacterium]
MTWFDYAVFAVLGFSLLVGVLRGLTRELLSLAGWVAAFVLATVFSGEAARWMPESLGPLLGGVLAFLAVFIGVLLVTFFIGLILAMLLRAAGLGAADRLLGAAFGFARGIVIVLVAVMLGGLTPLPREPFWRQAVLSGPFETSVLALKPFLPDGLAQRLQYR